jgi:2-polyprenyl-3-methyl-5-hydroxy-6-metoxy-1,4-benzoquinol methylase
MGAQSISIAEWQRHHFLVESDYARKILLSKKNSIERSKLLKDGYNEIVNIISAYNPGGGETDYTEVVVSVIKKLLKRGSKIFDLGCASGNLLLKLANNGFEIEGIDVSEGLVEKAKLKLASISKSDSVRQADIIQYQIKETFDCIVLDNVIEHFHPDLVDDILGKCYSLLNSTGYIFILTPHKFSGPHDVSKCFLPLGSKAQGFHLKEYSFTDLKDNLVRAGFNNIFGFPFHPRLFRSMRFYPRCSRFGARKAIFLEKLFSHRLLSKSLRINSTLSHILVALLFPAVCVAKK